MLTEEHRKYHRMYEENIPKEVREMIDDQVNFFMEDLRRMNYATDNGDAAEVLVASITKYFIHSNPTFRSGNGQ